MVKRVILIVDDDQGFARSLANMLRNSGYESVVCHEPASALEEVRIRPVDCALIDHNLGSTLGTALISRLEDEGFSFPKIMITGYGDVRTATSAMKLGAVDFIEKPFDPDELLSAIEAAIAKSENVTETRASIHEAKRLLSMLTKREREILDAIASGASSKQIAETLSLSPRTVEVHRSRILQKLRFSSTAPLVRLVVLAGLGKPHS